MNGGFDNIEAAELSDDSSLTGSDLQAQVMQMANQLSVRIDKAMARHNRVSFTLSRDIASELHKLARLEGISLSQLCERLVVESMTDE